MGNAYLYWEGILPQNIAKCGTHIKDSATILLQNNTKPFAVSLNMKNKPKTLTTKQKMLVQ